MTLLVPTNAKCAPAARNPFRELEDRMNRLFGAVAADPEWNVGAWSPAVDIREDAEKYVVSADLPGLKKEDISISVMDDVLTLKGERKHEAENKGEGFHRIERAYGTFQRNFRIPGGVDANRVEASFEQGVLTISLPKPETAKPKTIEVKVN